MRRRVINYDSSPPEATLTDTDGPITSTGAHTHADMSFGPEHPTRMMVATIGYSSSTVTPSVTIGGVAATKRAAAVLAGQNAEIWTADVPTGTSEDVVIGAGTGTWTSFVALYSVVFLVDHTPSNTASDTTGVLNISLPVPGYGVAIAIAYCGSFGSPGTATWSGGVVEDCELSNPNSLISTASGSVTVPTTLSIECTGLSGFQAGVAASFR